MRRGVRPFAAVGAAAILAAVATLAWGLGPWVVEAEARKARPDLVVSSLGNPPSSVVAGWGIAAEHTVKNRGRAKAGASTTGLYLSFDEIRDDGDLRVGQISVGSLRSGKSASAQAVLDVPESIPLGDYFLVACADDLRKVRESSERNNCRSAAGKVAVEEGAEFPLAPDPLNVTPTLDQTRSVTKRIETGGGTLSATAADGTVFTLTLPSNALLSPEEITMTPVSGLGGLPLSGGLVGAVDLKPDGLQLIKPAKLKIEPPASVPVGEQTGFSYHGGGEDFHLQPLEFGPQLSFDLTHFSAYGVGRGTGADRAAQQQRFPLRTRAQYEQLVSEAVRPARAAQLLGVEDDSDWEQKTKDYLIGYYRQVVKPALQQAESDGAQAEKAVQVGVHWVRQIQLLGLEDDPVFAAQIEDVSLHLRAIIDNAIEESFDRCVNLHDVGEVSRMLGLERAGRALGLNLGVDAFHRVERCSRFELDVLVTGAEDNKNDFTSGSVSVRVDSLPIRWDEFGRLSGEKDHVYNTWSVQSTNTNCPTSYSTLGTEVHDPFEVAWLDIRFNFREERLPDGSLVTTTGPPRITLHVNPGSTTEISNATSCGGSNFQDQHDIYSTAAYAAHQSATGSTFAAHAIPDWNFLGGTAWATKQVSGTYDAWITAGVKGTGSATYELHHAPAP